MKKVFLAVAMVMGLATNAQISPKFNGDPEDFQDLKKRTLIVEVLEEDPKVLKKLDKPKKAEELKEYQSFIKEFNEDFRIYAPKYWTLNSNIEYKTTTEIDALQKSKNKSYAVLRFILLNDNGTHGLKTNLNVPALAYTRIENNRRSADSKIYLPYRALSKGKSLLEADYKYALETLQANINWIIKNDKTLHFDKYAEKMAEENCSKLKGKTILVPDYVLKDGRSKEQAIKNYGGDLKFVSDEEINNAFVTKAKNTAVLFVAPYGIVKGSAVVVQMSTLVYFKVVADCETGEVDYLYMPSGFNYGANVSDKMTETEFKTMGNCKIL
ncbi:hypothetical protein FEDK69T_05750 [Flavobacterium enshiense DK69]|uniref:Uncharacterized protein n=2 Tax=Flavobacterium TaxID=237 RepID=V6SEJ4_9FLAO|nr:hypothetical protein [Flavobacterium enshiense]ESU24652.1 hypothetical protein FEDK69T_05750 [Flavobacterium enshiense DK69]KGO95481.1 hypothetical protein Q767_11825 [Flavobacterium enshiense DK69]